MLHNFSLFAASDQRRYEFVHLTQLSRVLQIGGVTLKAKSWKSKSWLLVLFASIIGSVSSGEEVNSSVFVWYTNGVVRQVSPQEQGLFYQACIHPGGESVIFSGNVSGGPRIWRRDLPSYKIAALTPENAASIHGVYSWDGMSIAFTSDQNSDQPIPTFTVEEMTPQGAPPRFVTMNIHLMDTDGGNVRQLTFSEYTDQRPTFSPDGKTITFVRFVDDQGETIPTLWSVPSDGSTKAQPIKFVGNRWAYRPWYSADGNRIFFFTIDKNERHRLASISVEGGVPEFFAPDDEGRSHGPFVDPNGKVLLMHSTRGPGDKHKIWEVPLRGGVPKQLAPPGFDSSINVMHATRSTNGTIAFDAL